MSFKEYLGIEDSLLPGLATGFGAGIGRKGSLCGAFVGSIMAIGMKVGRTGAQDQDRKEKAYTGSYRFWNRFEEEFGACECFALIGCRLDNPEERRRWLDAGGMAKCAHIVERTARILTEILEEP